MEKKLIIFVLLTTAASRAADFFEENGENAIATTRGRDLALIEQTQARAILANWPEYQKYANSLKNSNPVPCQPRRAPHGDPCDRLQPATPSYLRERAELNQKVANITITTLRTLGKTIEERARMSNQEANSPAGDNSNNLLYEGSREKYENIRKKYDNFLKPVRT